MQIHFYINMPKIMVWIWIIIGMDQIELDREK